MPSGDSAPSVCAETLYLTHHSWLQAWLQRRLGCSDTSADIAQDTFVRLLTKPVVGGIREPRAYLRTIAHGLTVNHLRRKDIERAYLAVLALQPEPLLPSLEEQALVVEALSSIVATLEKLPRRACEVFLLSQMDGLTYRQIAEQLDISVNVVQKDMLKALSHCYAAVHD